MPRESFQILPLRPEEDKNNIVDLPLHEEEKSDSNEDIIDLPLHTIDKNEVESETSPEPKHKSDKKTKKSSVKKDDSNNGDREEKDKKPRKRRVAIVDTSEALEDQARDMAEERMTASKAELKGMKGFFKKIWKHNLAHEYYRQKEIALAKTQISESGNLFVGDDADQEAHDEAMNAVVDRFVSEYENEDIIHEGESRKIVKSENAENTHLNESVRGLIKDFASGKIDEDSFRAQRDRVIAEATGLTGDKLTNAVNHTDNLFEIAQQAKMAVEHGASIDDIDQEIEVVVGKARIGVRTEAQYNVVDRIAEKIKSSKIGRFLNETTINSGVAIAYATGVAVSQRIARSKAVAVATFGGSAIVGGAIAGIREGVHIEDERKQHAREMAKGKEMTADMTRRVELEKARYNTLSAKSLYESIQSSANKIDSSKSLVEAINILSEAESRIKLSDRENIDLISYSDFKSIEQERFRLDIARAEAKVKIKNIISKGDITLPDGASFDDFLKNRTSDQMEKLRSGDEGLAEKDRLFRKIKLKHVAKTVVKATLTGLGVGLVAQEATAFLNSSQEGLLEHSAGHHTHSTTTLEGLRRWIMNEHVAGRVMHDTTLSDGSHVKLPDGVEILPNPHDPSHFILSKDGEVVSDKIEFVGGKLSHSSEEILNQNEIHITQNAVHLNNAPKDVIEKRPDLFHKIHRKFWYDNNTPEFDKNELKLQWGGEHGTGIDSNGHYVFSTGKMTPDGSMFKDMSVDAQEAMKNGQLKLLLSLSKDSQFNVVEVPIDAHGNVNLDPNSDIAKMFFSNHDGHLTFIGKFAEVAHTVKPGADGVDKFEILATHVGKGVDAVTTDTPITTFDVTDHEPDIFPPPIIPLFGRKPLETLKNASPYIDYAYGGFSNIDRKEYEPRFSQTLRDDPNATLDEKKEIKNYLEKQEAPYLKQIKELASMAGGMNPECKLSVCIPVAGHQEGKNIYKTLQNYLNQTAKPEDFEIVLLVNQPDKNEKGDAVMPDETLSEIRRFVSSNPTLKVKVMHKVIPVEQARIGYVRKLLNDSVLERNLNREKTSSDHIIVSNDADNKGISPEYIQNFLNKFKEHPETDAYMGQLDWDLESYVRNPLVHVGTRLFQYVELQLQKGNEDNIASSGANFAFRSSIYAAVNGYSKDIRLAEDVDLGRAIKAGRMNAKDKKAVGYAGARVSRLFTSSRRAEKAVLDGLSPVEQWSRGFSAFDDEVRKVDWESISNNIDYDDPENVKVLVDQIQNIVNRTMGAMKWANKDLQIFKRALGWLGIKYKLVGVNKIEIIDASKLVEGLKEYSTDAVKILQNKTAKISQN